MQGVPPLTGDGSQFDVPLDHTDPSPRSDDRQTSMSSGGRTFVVAFAVICALLAGLIAGFAAGFFVGQRADMIPAPRSAAEAVAPVPTTAAQAQTYTDAPIADSARPASEPARVEPTEARPTIDTTRRETSNVPRTAGSSSGSLQIASRPSGAQVFVDDVRVGVTPMSLADVSAGSHRVRMELAGFRRWVTAVNVESGTRARVGASLER